MTQAFGVTQAMIEGELSGSDLDAISTDITRWVAQYGAIAEVYLRRLQFSVDDVAALGDTDSLYLMCQTFVTHMVTSRACSALSWADPEKAQYHIAAAAEIEQTLRALPDSSTEAIERTAVHESKAPRARRPSTRKKSRWAPGGSV